MRFIKIYTILALTLLGMSDSIAQESFDRLYRVQPERSMFGQSIQQLADDSYVVLATVDTIDPGMIDPTMVNLTTFNHKGNVNVSFDYAFDDTISLIPYGNAVDLEEGYIISGMSAVDSVYNNLVFRVDKFANPIWSNKYGSGIQGEQPLFSKIDILDTSDSIVVLMGSAKADVGQHMLLSGIDIESGDQLWSKSLSMSGDDEVDPFSRNMTLTNDSTLLLIGNQSANEFFFITEISPETGNIIWAEKYDVRFLENSRLAATDIAVAEDSTIVITGLVLNSILGANDAFMVKLDKRGNILWSQFMNAGESVKTNGQSIDVLDNGNIVVAIGGQNNDAGAFFPIQVVLSPTGALLFASDYSIFLNSTSNAVEIIPTKDGGSIFAGTGIEHGIDSAPGTDVGYFYTRLIKTNAQGQSLCEMELPASLDSIFLGNDTLLWESSDLPLDKDTLKITTVGFGQYTAPILSLRDTMFCPGDPVMFLLDATTRGAAEYKWYTADEPDKILSTDSTYVATELDVQYIAEVLVREDMCYIMCDTTVLTDVDPPTVQLQLIPDRFCLEGLFELDATIQGSSIESVEWSTGEVDKTRIEVGSIETYSVTVTNICNDSGTASLTISEADRPQPVNLVLANPDACSSPGNIVLGVSPAEELSNIVWSTGATTATISVSEPGTYTVTARDLCGTELSDAVTITEDDFVEPLEIEIVSENCDNDEVDLSVNIISGTAQSIDWGVTEDGERRMLSGDEQLNVPADKTYDVIVEDACQNREPASIKDPCQCLKFPNAFYPDSSVDGDSNKEFGPVNSCSAITSYNLQIFNRWGQKVFESDALDNEWNGRNGSKGLRGDVYVYVATYETEGGEFRIKGDVTLLR